MEFSKAFVSQEVDAQDMIHDATNWEEAYAHDYRWLSGHNHDHVCATTCVKKMKKATMEDRKEATKRNKAPPCRFWFLHVVVLMIWTGMQYVTKKLRRRGKTIMKNSRISTTKMNKMNMASWNQNDHSPSDRHPLT